jgi:hypothetical protein
MKQQLLIVLSPIAALRNPRRSVNVIFAIYRSALVTVKPRTVTTKRKENRKWDIRVVPHKSVRACQNRER